MSGRLQQYVDPSFRFYPANMVIGVVAAVEEAEVVVGLLPRAGFPDQAIHVWYRQSGEEAFDVEGDGHGVLAAAWRAAQTLTGEREMIDRYVTELHAGRVCIGVDCEAREDALRAVSVLERNGAYYVNYCTTAAIERFPTPSDEDYERQPGAMGEGGH